MSSETSAGMGVRGGPRQTITKKDWYLPSRKKVSSSFLEFSFKWKLKYCKWAS